MSLGEDVKGKEQGCVELSKLSCLVSPTTDHQADWASLGSVVASVIRQVVGETESPGT